MVFSTGGAGITGKPYGRNKNELKQIHINSKYNIKLNIRAIYIKT